MTLRVRFAAGLLALAASTAGAQAPAAAGAGWLRYPAISPDGRTIVFTYKGDLYRVPAAGGTASALTVHAAHDFMPVWSHDGRQIAFASDRHGNFDVWVIPAEGGAARRLTHHSAPEYPYDFSGDDRHVLFGAARQDAAGNRQYPAASQPELWRVPAAGGRPLQLLTTPAENVRASRDGRFLVYEDRKGGENQWRKHHVSAVARDLWVHDVRAGTHRKVTSFAGEDRNPVLSDDGRTLWYLSEESGTLNVHQASVDGGASRRLTSFTGAPVRFLSRAGDGTLAFGWDGAIYTMKEGGQPQRVPVTIATDAKGNAEKLVQVTRGARELAVSPSGKEVAFIYRGDVFVTAVEGAMTKRITSTPETEASVAFTPDGKALVYASERGGRWGIYEARIQRPQENYFFASTVVREAPLVVNDRQNTSPRLSPDGKEIGYLEDRNTLRVYDLASRQARTLLTDKEIFGGGQKHFAWSPDGRWILFDMDVPGLAPSEVGLVRADAKGGVRNLTLSGFDDGRAAWIMNGKAMLWFSNRDGLRSVAQTGQTQQDVYAMFFDKEAWERFRLSKEEFALLKEAEEKAAKTKADSAKAKADSARKEAQERANVVLDLDDIENRKARLTIHSANLGDALVSKDGETLYYLARFEKGMNLWTTNLRTKETKMLLPLDAQGGNLEWDKEQKSLFLLADSTISKIDVANGKRETIRLSGEMTVDEDAERMAQFDHVWRTARDRFYTAGYHGADWNALRATYAKHVPHVGNGHEMAELLAELLGELNVSHSGSAYSASSPTADATASLGVLFDPAWAGAGAKVVEVLRGGPLDRPGVAVRAGTVIESVDGVAITPETDIAELLNRKAGKNVLLALANGSAKSEAVVKPIAGAEENRLLYARWVKRNQEEVARLSDGKLGYVHIPGMNDGAYRTTFEEVMGRYATSDGIVVDTRFNGGGDLVADLAMFLSGRKFFDYTTDTRSAGYEPNFRWSRPSVALANEGNYSDGHCFAYAYKEQKIGPLVGMPVPGTCTFAGWEVLGDGLRWGVPGLGVKDASTGKYLENLETEPDIKVMNEYDKVAKGRDQQLEAAVAALKKLVGPTPPQASLQP